MNCEGFIPSFQKGVRMNIHLPLPPPLTKKREKNQLLLFCFRLSFMQPLNEYKYFKVCICF